MASCPMSNLVPTHNPTALFLLSVTAYSSLAILLRKSKLRDTIDKSTSSTTIAQRLARSNILTLQPYRCARDDYDTGILLDANEVKIRTNV